MEYIQAVLFRIPADKIEAAESPEGLLAELDEHRGLLGQLRDFEDMRIIRSINQEGEVQFVVESRWKDGESLMEYETQEPNVHSIVSNHEELLVADSLQVTDMEAVRPQAKPEPIGEASQRWALPLLVPVGVLAFALLAIYGLSRIYLELRHEELGSELTVATPLAAGITAGILALAWLLSSRPSIRGWQIAAVAVAVMAILLGASIFTVVHPDSEVDAEGHEPVAEQSGEDSAALADEGAEFTVRMIPTTRFDTDALTIPAGQDVSVEVINEEVDAPHSFAVYQGESGEDLLARTDICNGPCSDTVSINLPAGEYQFRCEVHLDQMAGTITAT